VAHSKDEHDLPVLLLHHAPDGSWLPRDPCSRYLRLKVLLPFPFSSSQGQQQVVVVVGVEMMFNPSSSVNASSSPPRYPRLLPIAALTKVRKGHVAFCAVFHSNELTIFPPLPPAPSPSACAKMKIRQPTTCKCRDEEVTPLLE